MCSEVKSGIKSYVAPRKSHYTITWVPETDYNVCYRTLEGRTLAWVENLAAGCWWVKNWIFILEPRCGNMHLDDVWNSPAKSENLKRDLPHGSLPCIDNEASEMEKYFRGATK